MTVIDTRLRPHRRPLAAVPLLCGLWLLAAPFVLGYAAWHPHARAMLVDLVVGSLVASLSALHLLAGDDQRWASRLTVVLGLFLLAAPAFFSYGPDVHLAHAVVDDVVTGAVTAAGAALALATAG